MRALFWSLTHKGKPPLRDGRACKYMRRLSCWVFVDSNISKLTRVTIKGMFKTFKEKSC
jgi:hypothetical protein